MKSHSARANSGEFGCILRAIVIGLLLPLTAAFAATGATAVHVTHDRDEAVELADRIALMRAGTIMQIGTPAQLRDDPTDEWVAAFLR